VRIIVIILYNYYILLYYLKSYTWLLVSFTLISAGKYGRIILLHVITFLGGYSRGHNIFENRSSTPYDIISCKIINIIFSRLTTAYGLCPGKEKSYTSRKEKKLIILCERSSIIVTRKTRYRWKVAITWYMCCNLLYLSLYITTMMCEHIITVRGEHRKKFGGGV